MEAVTFNKSELPAHLPPNFVLIGFASFEMRSAIVTLSVNLEQVKRAIIFHSKENEGWDSESEDAIKSKLPSCMEYIKLDIGDPIGVGRQMTTVIKELINENYHIVIDITTFTHETLLMLLKLVCRNKDKFASVICLYNGAEEYSVNDPPERVWLSKGCKEIRNVIGYPGLIRPSSKNHLILLSGFELERATKIITLIEPDKLTLGNAFDSVNEKHLILNKYFKNEFDRWKDSYKNITTATFSFSCKDIEATVAKLNEIINENPDDNFIIAPLNTKLSTISTSIVALQKEKRIQVCYSVPEIYNKKNYSKPSDNITKFTLITGNGCVSCPPIIS